MIREMTMNAMKSRIGSAPASGLLPPTGRASGPGIGERGIAHAEAARDDARQGLDAGLQRAGVVLAREPLAHEIANPPGGGVGDDALESASDLDPHASGARTPLLPRHDQQDDPRVARRVAHRGVLSDAPGAADLARHVGLFAVADGGKRDHGDLGAGGRFQPGGEVGDPRLGRLIHEAGDIGHESGGASRKEAAGGRVLREERSRGQLKHRRGAR